jgi:methylmalonyl-CoA mutase
VGNNRKIDLNNVLIIHLFFYPSIDMPLTKQNLFSEFKPVTKAEWFAKIEKDLKGRVVSELDWQIVPPLSIAPFIHADDFLVQPEPIFDSPSTNTWAIAEDIDVADFAVANKQTLAALMAGVNAPRFVLNAYPSVNNITKLLENVELDYISTHFHEKTENHSPLSFLKSFAQLAGGKAATLKGAVHYDPFSDGRHDVKATTDLINWASENLPSFAVVTVNAERFHKNTEGVVSELSNTLKAGENYLKRLTDNGLVVENIVPRMAFRFQIGSSYFVEIAKLRAFKLLWGNVLSAYSTTPLVPRIFAKTTPIFTEGDVNIHKIQATTEAMSAIIGGVETLTVAPSETTDFGRRIARNVQHLLSMESYFDRVADPSAGSYYIEKLTEQLAEAAWSEFQNQY